MSKNIKIDSKHASITEIRTAIETLSSLEKKSFTKRPRKSETPQPPNTTASGL